MSLFADHNLPFSIALVFVALLALVQLFGLGGFEVDADGDIDMDADGSGQAGWLNGIFFTFGIGKLPFSIWLVFFLTILAAAGVSIQSLAEGLLGAPLDMWLGVAIAAGIALPATGIVARPLARILPRDESSAISVESLVGRRARIAIGRASVGSPARAQVSDHFGQSHNVMVEPHDPAAVMVEGDEVLLVRREGEVFFGVAVQDRRLAPA